MLKKLLCGICCLGGGCLVGFCSRELNQTLGVFGMILGLVLLGVSVTIFTKITNN